MRRLVPVLLCLLGLSTASAAVGLPSLFGDHMVLQSDRPVHIWGTAEPGESVTIAIAGRETKVAALADGRWNVYLAPMAAGGPHVLTVQGDGEPITVSDILVGEVWVGSGQSNMVWPVQQSNDAEAEIAAANYPSIRYFLAAQTPALTPSDNVGGEWKIVSPETVGEMSAVGYFFARHLHKRLDVPFGFVQAAWGGTPAESWTSTSALESESELRALISSFAREKVRARPRFERALKDWMTRSNAAVRAGRDAPTRPAEPRVLRPQHEPSSLFNGMIAPLMPYAIRGVIWYQGENNGNRGHGTLYQTLFRTMIQDWRARWGMGRFPFLFVQLANYGNVPEEGTWAELREAQAAALELSGTGMAVTIDIGNSTDIHPRNKQDVGRRLALVARATTYGEPDLEYSGPTFRQATPDGDELRLWFSHVAGGLQAHGGALKGFELAGADGKFVEAMARIEGESVVLSHEAIPYPTKARYAWAADPQANLQNAIGLPAAPFRTQE